MIISVILASVKCLQIDKPRAKLAIVMNYLGIDLGGTKTLLAVFDKNGQIISQKKIATDSNYDVFLREVEKNVADLSTNKNVACGLAIPGLIDRSTGTVHSFGNIGWQEKPIRSDISKAIGNIPVIIENDARIAGLAEAELLKNKYNSVLYLTISTGIGGAFIKNGEIVKAIQDSEMGHMPLPFEGKIQRWEQFASGKAIVQRYHQQASEITDPHKWKEIGENIGYGLAICCSILQPESVVFGGGAGQYSAKFTDYVKAYLDQHQSPIIPRPKALLPAHFGADSAIHGCFTLISQQGLVSKT